jgi:hypothetical protein
MRGGRRGEIKGQCPSNICLIIFLFLLLENVVLASELQKKTNKNWDESGGELCTYINL